MYWIWPTIQQGHNSLSPLTTEFWNRLEFLATRSSDLRGSDDVQAKPSVSRLSMFCFIPLPYIYGLSTEKSWCHSIRQSSTSICAVEQCEVHERPMDSIASLTGGTWRICCVVTLRKQRFFVILHCFPFPFWFWWHRICNQMHAKCIDANEQKFNCLESTVRIVPEVLCLTGVL